MGFASRRAEGGGGVARVYSRFYDDTHYPSKPWPATWWHGNEASRFGRFLCLALLQASLERSADLLYACFVAWDDRRYARKLGERKGISRVLGTEIGRDEVGSSRLEAAG